MNKRFLVVVLLGSLLLFTIGRAQEQLPVDGNSPFTDSILIRIFTDGPETWNCLTAAAHRHDDLVDTEITISGWRDCVVNGTVRTATGSAVVNLFADELNCADGTPCLLQPAAVGKTLRIRYCRTCGQVLQMTDGPAILTPMPPPCPTPTSTATPSPIPTVSPTLSPTPQRCKKRWFQFWKKRCE